MVNPFVFSVELHQSPTKGWFQPKNRFVWKARLTSSLRDRIFGGDFLKQKNLQKKTHPEGAKIHPACRWSLDN